MNQLRDGGDWKYGGGGGVWCLPSHFDLFLLRCRSNYLRGQRLARHGCGRKRYTYNILVQVSDEKGPLGNRHIRILRTGNRASVSNYRPTVIFSAFSKVFEFVIPEHISYYVKTKLNFSEHGIIKINSATTNFITFLYTAIPADCSEGQSDPSTLIPVLLWI
jgi:hypothetical protein